jgi:hypothetical protein
MKATTEQISEMMMKYNDFAAKVSEMIVVKADTTKTYEELDKLIKHATDLNKSKSLEIVLSFMGKASDQTFLGEKITQITGWLTTLSDLITGKVREYLVNFKGFDNGWFWLGSLIDNLIVKLNNLYTAANRSATFTTNYVTNGVPPTTSGNSTTTVESGGGGGGYEYADNSGSVGLVDSIQYAAEGGSIPGTGTGDTVPAMLTPGEFVVKAPVVRGLGEGFFHFVNSLKSFSVPRFNMGGLVQSFAGGGLVKNREVFTLNLQSGSATLPLTVMGKPSSVRQSLRQFEKEISRMRLSRG